MNKKTLTLGIIVGVSICYVLFLAYYVLKPETNEAKEIKTYEYVLTNKDLNKYEKVTCNDITKIKSQDDNIGEIKLTKQINSDLLDISSNTLLYLSKNINKYSILHDEYLLTYDEVINEKKEDARKLNKNILEIEPPLLKEQEGFDVDENIKSNYESILDSFDVSKNQTVLLSAGEHSASADLIEITRSYILISLNEDDYEYFQSIKDTELISIKLNYT